jgi:hypothetical protein
VLLIRRSRDLGIESGADECDSLGMEWTRLSGYRNVGMKSGVYDSSVGFL